MTNNILPKNNGSMMRTEVVVEPQIGTDMACQVEMKEQEMPLNVPDTSAQNNAQLEEIQDGPQQGESLFVLVETPVKEHLLSPDGQVTGGLPNEGTQEGLERINPTNGSSAEAVLTSSGAPSASNSPIVTMACVVCGTTIEMVCQNPSLSPFCGLFLI